MNLVGKALWYIETHFAEDISLEDVAAMADVLRFHMSRAFALATGRMAVTGMMVRLLCALLVGGFLAGCATSPPPGAPCCAAPEPGTVRVHFGGQLGVTAGFLH